MTIQEAQTTLRTESRDPVIIQRMYKQRALETHPDKGGSAQEFIQVSDAREILLRVTEQHIMSHGWSEFNDMKIKRKERDFQQEVVTALKQYNAIVWKIHGHGMQIAGIPDLYIAHTKFQGWLELKVEAKLSDIQAAKIKALIRRNVSAFVCRCVNDEGIRLENAEGSILATIHKDIWLQRGNRGIHLLDVLHKLTNDLML